MDAAKSLNNLEICDIVHEEFSLPTNKISPIEWAVDRVTNRYFLNSTPRLKKNFLKKCTERFDDLINGCPRIPRYEQKLSEVDAMYQGIWNDSSQSANRENWFKIKSRHRLGLKNSPPSGNDLGILAALMHRQEESKRKVQFITNDNDFLSFDERIREKLGIVVTPKYAFDPGNWNARRNL